MKRQKIYKKKIKNKKLNDPFRSSFWVYTLIMVVRETIIALAESKIKHKSCWHERY